MIERQNGAKTLLCDNCEEPLGEFFPNGQFDALIAHAKAQGWAVKPDGIGGWTHLCSDCRGGSTSTVAAQRKLLGL